METGSGKKILIVEDETDVVDLLALNLRKAGFRISSAADGASGLEKTRADKPDFVILDLMLPKMPGHARDSDPDVDGEGRGNRPDRWLGIRGRRLRGQTVQSARSGAAHSGHP